MARRFLTALAPVAPLGEAGGVTVVLAGVELWSDGVLLTLVAAPSPRADALLDAYDEDFAAWALRIRGLEHDDRPPPPEQPASRLVTPQPVVRDDAGTAYRWDGSSAGGTGTEWRAMVHLTPGTPPEATRLEVARGAAVVALLLPRRA